MDSNRLTSLEARVDALTRTVDTLAAELAAFRAQAPSRASAAPALRAPAASVDEQALEQIAGTVRGLPALIGIGFLVLAGAYGLRTLTESQLVSQGLGVALGLAYAAFWTFRADRIARGGNALDASGYGLLSPLIAFPIIWEATGHFSVLTPTPAAALLLAFSAAGLGVAYRHRLGVLSTVVGLATCVTATGAIWQTHVAVPYFAVLLLTAAAALWSAYRRDWAEARWLLPLALCGLGLTLRLVFGTTTEAWMGSFGPIGFLLGLVLLYLGSFAVHDLVLARRVTAFEIVIGTFSVLFGLEGAAKIATVAGFETALLGVVTLVAAVAAFAVAFSHLEDRREAEASGWYFALSVLLVFSGVRFLGAPAWVAPVWAAVATVGLVLGAQPQRRALRLCSALLMLAATVDSSLLRFSATAWAAASDALVPPPGVFWWVLLALFGSYFGLRRTVGPERAARSFTVPSFALVMVAGLAATGAVIALLAPGQAGALAMLRTGLLVALVFGCAVAARSQLRRELVWASYALLGLTAIKIVAEDLRRGQALTSFLAFALFGSALLGVPRLLKKPAA